MFLLFLQHSFFGTPVVSWCSVAAAVLGGSEQFGVYMQICQSSSIWFICIVDTNQIQSSPFPQYVRVALFLTVQWNLQIKEYYPALQSKPSISSTIEWRALFCFVIWRTDGVWHSVNWQLKSSQTHFLVFLDGNKAAWVELCAHPRNTPEHIQCQYCLL